MTTFENPTTYLPAGEGPSFWAFSEYASFKLQPGQTGGAFSVTEVTTLPEAGMPPHRHLENDEAYYILEGEYEFQDLTSNKTFRLAPGAFFRIERGVLHAYRNLGTTNARYLLIQTPGNIQGFFEELGAPIVDKTNLPGGSNMPEEGQLHAVALKYNTLPG